LTPDEFWSLTLFEYNLTVEAWNENREDKLALVWRAGYLQRVDNKHFPSLDKFLCRKPKRLSKSELEQRRKDHYRLVKEFEKK